MSESATQDASIQTLTDLGHINLRGSAKNPEFLKAANTALGQALPVIANTMTVGEYRIFWRGPDEWQIVSTAEETPRLLTRLREALAGQPAAASDQSGGYVVLHINGQRARDVLVKGCTLDLHSSEFALNDCVQCGLAKANVLIGFVDTQPVFEIVVRRSFADYVARWLAHVARDFRVEDSVA